MSLTWGVGDESARVTHTIHYTYTYQEIGVLNY